MQRGFQRLKRLSGVNNRGFAKLVARDALSFVTGVRPIEGETLERVRAAAEWLMRAQDEGGGVSYGYFPCEKTPGWQAPYPETTGYIITSLLAYARDMGDVAARESAMRMARWEVAVQMPSGAVQGGKLTSRDKQTPAAFNTGMVLDGLVSAASVCPEPDILNGARKAADFLVSDLTAEGYFRTNGEFVSRATIKTYNCLCAWALMRFGRLASEARCEGAAVHAISGALKQQLSNGWFANNCLDHPEAPLLHTIGYTLQGVLEVGALAQREDFIDAARRGAEPIAAAVSPNGFIAARLDAEWQPAAFSACLTGSAQFAVVCYRLAELTNQNKWRSTADRIVNFLKGCQTIEANDPGVRGALAGSFPILGEYQTMGYPNWATKYFLDALLLQLRLNLSSHADTGDSEWRGNTALSEQVQAGNISVL